MSQPSFFWRKPAPLVGTIGAAWDFQNSLNLSDLTSDIERHYQAWKDGKTNSRNHPLFVCVDSPGTGKSRLLDEFPDILQQQIFGNETHGDPAMKLLLQNAYTFKVSFGNGTRCNYGMSDPRKMIGTRMLFQLQNSLGWELFLFNRTNHVFPEQVFTALSEITGTNLSEMCVILCVDSMEMLEHQPGNWHSEFYTAWSSLCDHVNASKCWVICICATTTRQPITEYLTFSSQWTVMLHTGSLRRPTINGRDVFDSFGNGSRALTQLLVDDMGGNGRALEELLKVMVRYQGRAFEFVPIMHDLLAALQETFPSIVAHMDSIEQAFLAMISRQVIDESSRFGNMTLDQVVLSGLIQRDGCRLKCPFILYVLLKTRDMPWHEHDTFAQEHAFEDVEPWQPGK